MLLKDYFINPSIEMTKSQFHELSLVCKIDLSVSFSKEKNKHETELSLFFKTISTNGKACLVPIIFKNVCGLSMKELTIDNDGFLIEGFEVTNLSNSQMENISFEVNDYENETLHFYCENIIIENLIQV
jgi:hypothetical protein